MACSAVGDQQQLRTCSSTKLLSGIALAGVAAQHLGKHSFALEQHQCALQQPAVWRIVKQAASTSP
jgi:hypothetical protein